MDNSEKHQPPNNIEDADQIGGSSNDDDSSDANQSVTRRLTEILLQNSHLDGENGLIQWLGALNTHVIGGCREDERLKPLLKLNASSSVAEDRLLGEISQQFEPSEVGMLAMCLCMPLVSVRVGKVYKQGTRLTPTSIRGNLHLILLPTSDLCISFNGDDGSVERLATMSTKSQCFSIKIEQISADTSGRCFFIKPSETAVSYFWCSEKSKLLGDELLRKMNEMIVTKPSLAELTGISESRLNCLATNVRAYLAGSVVSSTQASGSKPSAPPLIDSINSTELCDPQSSSSGHKRSSHRLYNGSGSRSNLIYQGSLSPRSSSFKEVRKSPLSERITTRDKIRRRGEDCIINSPSNSDSSNGVSEPKLSNRSNPLAAFKSLDLNGKSMEQSLCTPEMEVRASLSSSQFSPLYCWCPPTSSTLQFTLRNSQLPFSLTESLSLPPLPSLTSTSCSSTILAEVPPLDFRTLLPEPLSMLQTSQQIPTFTPLICDPIVHVPMIDVCSSGQGYVISAGPSISTTSTYLNPNSLLPNAESALEKGARETLRMLINSSNQPNSQLIEVLPSVVLSANSNDKQDIVVTGSRGLYCGAKEVESIIKNMSVMGIVSMLEKSNGVVDDLINRDGKPTNSDSSSSSHEDVN